MAPAIVPPCCLCSDGGVASCVELTDAVPSGILAEAEDAAEEVKLECAEGKLIRGELSWTVVVLMLVLVIVMVL